MLKEHAVKKSRYTEEPDCLSDEAVRDRRGGGVSTVRQYLQNGLIDELHVALSPVLLGRGEAIFEGLDLPTLGYGVMESSPTDLATRRL